MLLPKKCMRWTLARYYAHALLPREHIWRPFIRWWWRCTVHNLGCSRIPDTTLNIPQAAALPVTLFFCKEVSGFVAFRTSNKAGFYYKLWFSIESIVLIFLHNLQKHFFLLLPGRMVEYVLRGDSVRACETFSPSQHAERWTWVYMPLCFSLLACPLRRFTVNGPTEGPRSPACGGG